jgi:hypothetical protein
LNRNGGLCEFVGLDEFQVKPYFDIDFKDIDNKGFDESIINEIANDIKKIYANDIYIAKRDVRECEVRIRSEYIKVDKYSYRLYLKARISYCNIPIVFKSILEKYDCVDKSVYDSNKRLFAPLSNRKRNEDVPPLNVVNGSIFDCCATYIQEDYEDLDLMVASIPKPEEKQVQIKDDLDDDIETPYEGNLNFAEIMTKYTKDRATEHKTWLNIGIALINLHHRKIIKRAQLYELFDLFSAKADNYKDDDIYKFLDYNIPRFNGKGYGIKYLLECLKVDDEEYYKQITKKDNMIEGANDDIGASKMVVDYHKDLLVICKGLLYVKFNDVWIYNQTQVDKLLIDMIGKLDIRFLGADGKRQYKYNTSIKHIKDCIVCIKANQTIINDKFYDEMIKNDKYYLPFNDCIYSFIDKRHILIKKFPIFIFHIRLIETFRSLLRKIMMI